MMPPLPPQGAPAARPRLMLKDSSAIQCPCGGEIFVEAALLRTWSRLLTGESKDSVASVPVMLCVKCNQPLEVMMPEELRAQKIVTPS